MIAADTLEIEVLDGGARESDGRPPWVVQDVRSAERALRRIREAYADLADRTATARELLEQHRVRIAELQQFVDDEEARTKKKVDNFEALLTAWHRSRIADDPKGAVSIRLSCGKLTSQAARDSVEVEKAAVEALAELADESGADFARWEPKVDRRKLLAWVKATGEVPPGVKLILATEDMRTFKVEVADV